MHEEKEVCFMRKSMEIKNLRINPMKRLCMIGTSFTLVASTLTGCGDTELSTNRVSSDSIIDFKEEDNFLEGGIQKTIPVPGENWNLIVQYSGELENSEYWTITDNKKLYMKIYTQNLPEGYQVYINDIHADTTIVARQSRMDGIKQDTMDDGIHGTTLLGFPIGNDTCCYIKNAIDGQNDEFISGSTTGFQGYTSGTITEKRFLESDYLEKGVVANSIYTIFGLLVKGPNDKDFRGIDVDDDIAIAVYNRVSYIDDNNSVYEVEYQTDENGNVTAVTYTEDGAVKKRKKITNENFLYF